ncbi:hypothetical protein [Pelagicoccus mobilis]|uniref:Uncharacterized protein n=1 Tax=Pelagicoccus mobilis TaxID=415221 RepID=A0A934S0S0_9BACT|nr:hypothetical protein [Pelagicoccus mobilis]MBK1877767.1 hypothetical protein [Pelagicoccus mobilis]
MTDTTTAKDLAKKIEWVGLRNLSYHEKERVRHELVEVSCYLPRLLALALWSFYGQRPPEYMVTRGSESSLQTYRERERTKSYIRELMADYKEED